MPKHTNNHIRPNVQPQRNPIPRVQPAGQPAAYARNASAYHAASKSAGHKKRIVIAVVAAVLVVLLGAGTAFALYMNYINDQLTRGSKSDEELANIDDALGYSTSLDKPFYMLLIGSDRRVNEASMGARSDTNIVVRVDPEKDQLTMVSIPRDTKVELEGHGTQKFNAAYAFGGAASTIRAAEDLLDIDIAHYAEVNFLELAGVVDAVGGVTVENESRIDNHKCDDGDGNHYVIEKGTQHLNGGEALTFARNRDYPDGDFTRQKHQRAVIEAIITEVLDMPITSIPGVIEAASKCVTTDLSVFDVIGLAQMFADAGDLTIYQAMLPSYTQTINGISFVINDEEKTKEMMELVEAGEDPSEIVSTMTASDITTSSVDTSNVLLFDDDDEVATGGMTATAPSGSQSSSSSAGTSAGGASSSSQATQNPKPDPTPTPPTQPSGGNDAPDVGGNTDAANAAAAKAASAE